MSISTAASRLSVLGQDSRLQIFHLLIEQGRDGVAVGKIAKQLHALYNTLSTDLAVLTRASLLASTRRRSINYLFHRPQGNPGSVRLPGTGLLQWATGVVCAANRYNS